MFQVGNHSTSCPTVRTSIARSRAVDFDLPQPLFTSGSVECLSAGQNVATVVVGEPRLGGFRLAGTLTLQSGYPSRPSSAIDGQYGFRVVYRRAAI